MMHIDFVNVLIRRIYLLDLVVNVSCQYFLVNSFENHRQSIEILIDGDFVRIHDHVVVIVDEDFQFDVHNRSIVDELFVKILLFKNKKKRR